MGTIYPDPLELTLARSYEEERLVLSGHSGKYLVLNKSSNVDPLYGEPDESGWVYDEFTLAMAVTYQEMENKETEAREEGVERMYDAEAFIAYTSWGASGPPTLLGADRKPEAGDVVFVMGHYFDVVKGSVGGNLVDSVDTTGYKIMLKLKSKFDAERRVG